jgi:2-polyprenyl-6-methoxyphenol hydroxylase-like FAD-dependent oxidoreductase
MVPLSQGRAYWFATKNGPEGGIDKAGERKPELLELFKDWHPAVRNVIEATPEEAILQNDIYDRKPSKSWSVGRVTLLGDAAHPMTPNMGQGACQALEDAIVLADCLKNQTEDIPAALGRYQEQRLAHTSLVVTRSWRIGQIAQVANPVACWLRDTTLKLAPPSLQMKQLEPVVGHEI